VIFQKLDKNILILSKKNTYFYQHFVCVRTQIKAKTLLFDQFFVVVAF
jgi:hypothetical protein